MSKETNPLVQFIKNLAALSKINITAVATLSAAAGYLWHRSEISTDLVYLLVGILLLACGSASLNQVQDVKLDSKMARTRNRPIPSGRMSRSTAFFWSSLMILLGMASVASVSGKELPLLALGGAAVFWYNGVYYYLKRRTAFAVVPGSVIGAIPPMMGWVAAGGDWQHPAAWLLAMFFFVWQIPHFWLLQVNRAHEYKSAGLPALTDHFDGIGLKRITSVWIWATATIGMFFPAIAGDQTSLVIRLTMVFASGWLVIASLKLLREQPVPAKLFMRAFKEINIYALAMMICFYLGAL